MTISVKFRSLMTNRLLRDDEARRPESVLRTDFSYYDNFSDDEIVQLYLDREFLV